MASNLLNIYDLVAAVSVSFTDSDSVVQTPGVIKPQTMVQNLTGASFPVRVLWLLRPDSEASVSPVTLKGGGAHIEWEIDDTFYFAPSGSGITLAEVTWDLTLYINAYTAAILAGRRLATGINVVSWRYEPGVYQWGKSSYWGVNCKLQISEVS